jgi:hypothetical protein
VIFASCEEAAANPIARRDLRATDCAAALQERERHVRNRAPMGVPDDPKTYGGEIVITSLPVFRVGDDLRCGAAAELQVIRQVKPACC